MSKEPTSLFYHLGKRIGWWIAENRHSAVRHLVVHVIGRLPGGGIITRLLR